MKRDPGPLRGVRGLGPGRRGRQAHLLRPLRAPAPRPGVGRHRPSATARTSSCTRTWAWSPRSSPRRPWSRCTATSPSGTRATRHRIEHLGERPADLPVDRDGAPGARPQRQPDEYPRAQGATGRARRGVRGASARHAHAVDQRHRHRRRAACRPSRPHRRGSSPRGAASPARRVLPGVHGRRRPLRSQGSAGRAPARLGRLERGWVIASETAALDIVGASFVREVEPGELIVVDENGLRSHRFAEADPKGCLFEFVYLARRTPASPVAGYRRPASRRPAPGPRARGGGGPWSSRCRSPAAMRPSLRTGVRYPVRRGAGQERLRRPDLHSAFADHPPARYPGSSSIRCATSSRVSASSSSTTRSCAATPSVPWCGCSGRPVLERCTCASPVRR